ncbi:AfsR/SARP family transcriptional regulator [Ruania zhangjianzhongii]|uniref:AfsR/SARP family transcriptional regulator n=1 Tax=Ruania zhangjianzhongii TaxID=2603206 RepID=UPI0011CCA4C6|nr:BTAD domain-containing putative transcriptional regulator [Ruania zhangjianzhongii]
MRFRVLGPVALRAEDWLVPGPGLRSTLLGALLAARGAPVSADALVAAMWGELPGEGAHSRLQVHVHRLRKLLDDAEAVRLIREGAGYRLLLETGELDAEVFDRLADRVLDRDCAPDEVGGLATEALELWQGEAFAGVSGDLVDPEATRLNDRRRAVLEAKFAARLRLGEHREILDEVRSAARAHPLHEGLQAQLMSTLAAGGRRSDALAAYRDTREILVEELGIEPGHQLRSLHEEILLGGGTGDSGAPRPHQLPPAPVRLLGREQELARLDETLLTGPAGGTATLTGAPGIGKTALALAWAHSHAESFSDGQLYVDLQGFGPGEPLSTQRVLLAFLRALGAPGEAHSWPVAEQTTLLRSLTHGRRLLMLLDNAASVEQVRPLLAGSGGCTVLLTSRLSLSGLALHEGAQTIEVPHLSQARASELLSGAFGSDGGPEALAPLLECCAGLPLALAIVAERARSTPGATAADLVAEITATAGRLDRFDLGEEDGSLRSILTWSYQSLSETAQLVFRTMGAFPGFGPDIGALAAISEQDYRTAARAVDELVRAHLVTAEDVQLRQHDLLRDLAAELAEAQGPALDQGAVTRLIAYWVLRGRQLLPRFIPEPVRAVDLAELGLVQAPDFTDDERARRWWGQHLPSLLDAAALSGAYPVPSLDRLILVLSRTVAAIAAATGATAKCVPLTAAAQDAAERVGERHDVVRTRLQHATAMAGCSVDAAIDAFRGAIALALDSGELAQAAIGTGNLGLQLARANDADAAREHYQEAVHLAEGAGDEFQANFWRCNVASHALRTGDLPTAERYGRRGLEEARRLGSDREITAASAALAEVALRRGDLDGAESWTAQAAEHARAKGLAFREADAEVLFGAIAAERGRLETANEHFRRAVTLASQVRRSDIVVVAYLTWAEALAAHGSADARSCLAEAGAVAQQSMERESLVAVQEKTREVERLLVAQAS